MGACGQSPPEAEAHRPYSIFAGKIGPDWFLIIFLENDVSKNVNHDFSMKPHHLAKKFSSDL